MKTEEILDKLEELHYWEIKDFISSLDLTPEQMEILANHEDVWVRWGLAGNFNLTDELMIRLSNGENVNVRKGLTYNPKITVKLIIKLSSDEDEDVIRYAFEKLKYLNSLSSDDLENAYDLIRKSKYISRENFEETFDYIAEKFPDINKLTKMFKRIILKGKKDLK